MSTYLLIDLFTLLVPLIAGFHPKIAFYKKWKALFPALAITALFFLTWDAFYTVRGIWSFNPRYILGLYIAYLPIEEWLFFICIPYSCVFIFYCLDIFRPALHIRFYKIFNYGIITVLVLGLVIGYNKWYTCSVFSLCLVMVIYHTLSRNYAFLAAFYRAYLLSLIPFFIVNGILTALPVVMYNNAENLGFRIFTIPGDDFIYSMAMLLMATGLFSFFSGKQFVP